MAKITNIRERVHQPLRDALIRTSGNYVSNVQDRTDLFTVAGGDQGKTNLQNGSTLPSDQSMVVLALRTFLWFRNPQLRAEDASGNVTVNGDLLAADFTPNQSTAIGSAEDVHRLYFQASEQLLWSVGAGQKYSLTSMPSAYFPYAGGLHGRLPAAAGGSCGGCDVVVTDTVPTPSPIQGPNLQYLNFDVQVGEECCNALSFVVVTYNPDDGVWETFNGPFDTSTGTWPYVTITQTINSYPYTINLAGSCAQIVISEPPPPPTAIGVNGYYAYVQVSSDGKACASPTLIHWNNGTPEAGSLTRLARAILIPPRQNILVSAQIVSYADNPQSSVATQGSRNLLSLTSNLNQQDYINKCITMTLDGLLSRDVQ